LKIRTKLTIATAGLTASLVLAACGGDDPVGGGNQTGSTEIAEGGDVSGKLTISNWPGYIDPGKDGTEAEFEEEYGVDIEYIEDVNDNAGFFGKVQPQLEEGESGGRSIFVVTDWMANQMHELGYLQDIDKQAVPNAVENLRPDLASPAFDPERDFSIPWQTGMTGIWVNTEEAPDVESINDLFDPKYKGKVTMLSELRDTVPLVMKADGVDPEEATTEDWLAAIDKIRDAAESGQIRRFTGNDYTEDITSGNVVAAIGWSGDASLISNQAAEWRMPTEGCMLWSDNMVFPIGAPNEAAALEFANYVYDPEVQADIAEYVTYVTPVDGVQDILAERDPELAENQLIFPSDDFTADCTNQVDPPDVEEVTEAFEDVITG
jgi:spermidine/putrescine transport system substrate-binding protein